MIRLDDILVQIGEFGPYQKRVFVIVCMLVFATSWQSLSFVFMAASVDHWCAEPQWDNFDCSTAGLNEETCMLAMKNASIPANYTSDHQLVFEQCMKYNVSGEAFDPNIDPFLDPGWPTSQVIDCDSGWVYDKSQYKSSIITDFDLVCGMEDQAQISQSVFYGGFLAGSIINGTLADM